MDRILCSLVVLAAALGAVRGADARVPRYAGLLANGQRIEGEALYDWHEEKARPRLEGQGLLDSSNPLRWLRDRSLALAEWPAALVEFQTGDRLPGMVIDAHAGHDETWHPQAAYLTVQPGLELSPPSKSTATEIRVLASFVRRIVWQRRTQQTYQPSTLFYRDGRSLTFRAIRFGSGYASVLLAEGNRKIPFGDLAEVHLPQRDVWENYFDDLAAVCPSGQSRLLQVETTSGLIATTSLERLAMRFEGNANDSSRWVHGLQPAWSLDLIWTPCRDIAVRRSFAPHEVPLSRLTPASSTSRSALGGVGRRGQTNRSALGTPLRSEGKDFGWGFGVQSRSELTFVLPAGVKSFRTWGAIDQVSGPGGCLKLRVLAGDKEAKQLWESPLLVGADQVVDSGSLGLTGPQDGQRLLTLQVDPATSQRPAGADPLDIRDNADWLDPLLELDPAVVKAEIEKRLPQQFAAWQGWQMQLVAGPAGSNDPALEVVSTRDPRRQENVFATAVAAHGRTISLKREVTIGPQQNWLVVAAARVSSRGKEPKLEIRIGGEPVAEHVVVERPHEPFDLRVLAVSLTAYQRLEGAQAEIEIRQLAAPDAPPIEWRLIQVANQLPTLHRIFEEHILDAKPIATAENQGRLAMIGDDHHFGSRALRITDGGSFRLALEEPVAIRERPQWGEFRFLRLAMRKRGDGQIAIEMEATQPRIAPARYDAGPGKPAFGSAQRIWQDKLSPDWVVITRDLYADFGNIDVSGVVLSCLGGDFANFDHIYLARTQDDFNLIPAAPSPEKTNEKARLKLAEQVIERTTPALVAIQLPSGRCAGGVLIRNDGEILTAGHVVIGPNRDVVVRLSDGRTLKAKTLGVSRELDLGLVKISESGNWPSAPLWDRKDLDPSRPYVALTWPDNITATSHPQAAVADVRRAFRDTLWTDCDLPDWSAGGVLVHPDGQIVGLHTRRSNFGGFVYARMVRGELDPYLQRMRNGEVWGAWPPGDRPDLGLNASVVPQGLKIDEIVPGQPAANAGLLPGDVLTRLEDHPLATPEDLSAQLAERDPGATLTLEYLRGDKPLKTTVILASRMP
jgi:S1-C subfamily serine protease